MLTRTPDAQRAYRERIKNGEHVVTPKVIELPPAIVLTDEQTTELESAWQVEYRKTIAAWLIRQRSPHTRRAYGRAWEGWIEWCRVHGVDPIEPPAGTGGAWVTDLLQQGKAPSSVSQYRVAVRQAILELTFNGLRSGEDPFARVRPLVQDDYSPTLPISDDDVHRLLTAATELGGKHRTAVLLCAVLGLRSFEAGQVCKATVQQSPWGPVASIVGKGQRRALIPLPPIVMEAAAIDGWPMDGARGSDYRERIRQFIRSSADRAGVRVQPHQLRHWHATAALDAGVPLEQVQDSLRHRDPKTTQRYNQRRDMVEKHSAFTVCDLPAIRGVA